LALIVNLNTKVDRLLTSAQFDRLTDKIDHLTYNTKAQMLNVNGTWPTFPPLPAASNLNDSTPTPNPSGPTKADFDELKRLVLSLSASVEAMRIQMATKEQVKAMAEQVEAVATREQVEELITTVDTLAYNTKARYCNKKRTDKGTALLSLKDKDGVLVNINHASQLWWYW
jgi:hypothetical protein